MRSFFAVFHKILFYIIAISFQIIIDSISINSSHFVAVKFHFVILIFSFFRFARSTSDNYNYQLIASRVSTVAGLLLVAGVAMQVVLGRVGVQSRNEIQTREMNLKANVAQGISADCHSAVSLGAYVIFFYHFFPD